MPRAVRGSLEGSLVAGRPLQAGESCWKASGQRLLWLRAGDGAGLWLQQVATPARPQGRGTVWVSAAQV